MSKTPLTDAELEPWELAALVHRLEQDRAELLATLKAVLPYLVGGEAILIATRAAIAKAEGK